MNFPIENHLEVLEKSSPSDFPESISYFSRYQTAVGKLRAGAYKKINTGLALLSEHQGLYTDHGPDHFEEVVRYLGNLVPNEQIKKGAAVEPYELFIILLAARIHDVGNSEGRDDHEKRCFKALKEIGDGSDTIERNLIAIIAQAHGGRSVKGCKDTIGDLPISSGVFSIPVDARKCAALVRIADEICENRKRSSEGTDFSNQAVSKNELYHTYAACISRNTFSQNDRYLTIEFDIQIDLLSKKYNTAEKEKVSLLEEIADRLEKLDLERRYCNTYLPEQLRIRGIKAAIKVYENTSDSDYFNSSLITSHDFQDVGYPSKTENITTRWPDLTPEKFNKLVSEKFKVNIKEFSLKNIFSKLMNPGEK